MFRKQGNSKGPGAPTKLPATGMTPSVGPRPPALKSPVKPTAPRAPNTRDYGKPAPAVPPMSPNPFGTDGGM